MEENSINNETEDTSSIFDINIERGKKHSLLKISDKKDRIIYSCSREYSTTFKNPEEKVRAAYFVELILDYQYSKQRINFEVNVPRRTPEDFADIVVYEDDLLKKTISCC